MNVDKLHIRRLACESKSTIAVRCRGGRQRRSGRQASSFQEHLPPWPAQCLAHHAHKSIIHLSMHQHRTPRSFQSWNILCMQQQCTKAERQAPPCQCNLHIADFHCQWHKQARTSGRVLPGKKGLMLPKHCWSTRYKKLTYAMWGNAVSSRNLYNGLGLADSKSGHPSISLQ